MLPYTSLKIKLDCLWSRCYKYLTGEFCPHFDLSKGVGQLVPTCVERKSVGLDPILVGIAVRCQSDVIDLATVQTREHA